jgi:signal transduction histidine kinase
MVAPVRKCIGIAGVTTPFFCHQSGNFWSAPDERIPSSLADCKRLQQVLINLVNNGINYNRKGGRLSFAVIAFSSGPIQIKIQDTGNGISSENQRRLFNPFDRLDVDQSDEKIEGIRLGLLISKKLVECMGWQHSCHI